MEISKLNLFCMYVVVMQEAANSSDSSNNRSEYMIEYCNPIGTGVCAALVI